MSALDDELAELKEKVEALDLLLEVAQGEKTPADVQKWLEENYPGIKRSTAAEKKLINR